MQLIAIAARKFGDGEIDEAITLLQRADCEDPDNEMLRRVLAYMLVAGGHDGEALDILETLPASLETLLVTAKAHEARNDLDAARRCARRAVALDPASNDARIALSDIENQIAMRGASVARTKKQRPSGDVLPGFTQIRNGDLSGFEAIARDYSAFIEGKIGADVLPAPGGDVPQWDGAHVPVLVVALVEGFGDCLQYARYLPLAAERCDRLIVVTYPALRGLLSQYETFPTTAIDQALLAADAYTYPFAMIATLGAGYGQPGGYLHADPIEIPGFNVGVVWAGSPANETDAFRSSEPSELEALQVDGVNFISLMQRDDDRPDWIAPSPVPLTDFAATARVVAGLDLVISVDTSVAHLAGALGVPVWIAIADPCCWRWQTHPTRTNWYESAMLWRQTVPGTYRDVFARMGAMLTNAVHPWTFSVAVLTGEDCDRVLAERGAYAPGLLYGGERNEQHRRCEQATLSGDLGWMLEALGPALRAAREELHAGALRASEPPIVAKYTTGDHFDWHVDEQGRTDRTLSCTVQLTDPDDYAGGDMEIMQPLGDRTVTAPRGRGIATFFPSTCLHRVKPVTRGERAALVMWFSA